MAIFFVWGMISVSLRPFAALDAAGDLPGDLPRVEGDFAGVLERERAGMRKGEVDARSRQTNKSWYKRLVCME
jgi:hypothetical protein